MEDTSEKSIDNQIVEEYPPPPLYYQLFKEINYLDKPIIPSQSQHNNIDNSIDNLDMDVSKISTTLNPYLKAYNGRFAHIQENRLRYNPIKDYKQDLKL